MGDGDRRREAGSAVFLVRRIRDKQQEDVERETGLSHTTLSDIEQGKKDPRPATLAKIAECLDVPLSTFAVATHFIRWVRTADRRVGREAGDTALELAVAQAGAAEERLARETADLALSELRRRARLPRERSAAATPEEARDHAVRLWERLTPRSPSERRAILAELPEFWSLDLVALLWDESEKAAAGSAVRAAELAGLALEVAYYLPEPERSLAVKPRLRHGQEP